MIHRNLSFLGAVGAISFVAGIGYGVVDQIDGAGFDVSRLNFPAIISAVVKDAQAQEGEPARKDEHADGGAAGEKSAQTESAEGSGEKVPSKASPQITGSGCIATPAALEDIRKQREKLQQAQKELAAKEVELKALEKAVHDEMARLDEVRKDIAKTDTLRKQENEERVTKLVETLETMNPKAGSTLLSSLDESLAVMAMSRLSTQKLAKIMNIMDPAKSTRLSEILAGVTRAKTVGASGSLPKTTAQNGVAGNDSQVVKKGGETQ